MRVLVMMPYGKNMLRAISDAIDFGIGSYLLMGDKKRIIEVCHREAINYQKFEIRNYHLDIDAIDSARALIENKMIDYLIFGDLSEIYQLKVLGVKNLLCLGSLDIIDLPFLRRFIFLSNFNRNYYVDFEEKKKAILQARRMMRDLDIKRVNASLVATSANKSEELEANMVKLLLNENKYSDIEFFGVQDFASLLSQDGNFNIYNSKANLLIMKNYEMSQVFTQTLSAFSESRIANFLVTNGNYILDYRINSSKENIYFGLIILSKIYNNKL